MMFECHPSNLRENAGHMMAHYLGCQQTPRDEAV
jgi:hypothetical protein